jgi:hypothetical protein
MPCETENKSKRPMMFVSYSQPLRVCDGQIGTVEEEVALLSDAQDQEGQPLSHHLPPRQVCAAGWLFVWSQFRRLRRACSLLSLMQAGLLTTAFCPVRSWRREDNRATASDRRFGAIPAAGLVGKVG